MKKNFALKARLALAALLTLALPMAQAQVMTKTEYSQAKTRIAADYKMDRAAGDKMAGNTKDVCVESAKAVEKVGLAEIEYNLSGKAEDQNKVLVAKAESAYAVAKEKCDDKAGNVKDVCVQEAKAAESKALAEAKMSMQMGDAAKATVQATLDADYKVAIEKCDTMSGDTKASCTTAAKVKYGKT